MIFKAFIAYRGMEKFVDVEAETPRDAALELIRDWDARYGDGYDREFRVIDDDAGCRKEFNCRVAVEPAFYASEIVKEAVQCLDPKTIPATKCRRSRAVDVGVLEPSICGSVIGATEPAPIPIRLNQIRQRMRPVTNQELVDQIAAWGRATDDELKILDGEKDCIARRFHGHRRAMIADAGRVPCEACDASGMLWRLDAAFTRRFDLQDWEGCPRCGGTPKEKGRGFH